MCLDASGALYASSRTNSEWHDVDYLKTATVGRNNAIPLLIALWIAVIDLCWARTNFSILYVVPLILHAWSGGATHVWRFVWLSLLLTFGIYFLKNSIYFGIRPASYFDYRLVNRVFVAATIAALGKVLETWTRWRQEQADPELSPVFQQQEYDVSATLAMLCCVPLVLVIAAVDFVVPDNYNLAILYPIPLFICGWTRSQTLLWAVLAVLLSLTMAAAFWGQDGLELGHDHSLARNRILAGLGLFFVTVTLSSWMGWKDTRTDVRGPTRRKRHDERAEIHWRLASVNSKLAAEQLSAEDWHKLEAEKCSLELKLTNDRSLEERLAALKRLVAIDSAMNDLQRRVTAGEKYLDGEWDALYCERSKLEQELWDDDTPDSD